MGFERGFEGSGERGIEDSGVGGKRGLRGLARGGVKEAAWAVKWV